MLKAKAAGFLIAIVLLSNFLMVPFDEGFYLIWHLTMGMVGILAFYKAVKFTK